MTAGERTADEPPEGVEIDLHVDYRPEPIATVPGRVRSVVPGQPDERTVYALSDYPGHVSELLVLLRERDEQLGTAAFELQVKEQQLAVLETRLRDTLDTLCDYEAVLRYIAEFQAETESDAECAALMQAQARAALPGPCRARRDVLEGMAEYGPDDDFTDAADGSSLGVVPGD